MLSPEESQKTLLKMFRKKYIADLDHLFRILQTNSRMSVFRRLKLMGYYTSFTHTGRYYTLQEIPKFDPWGLWFYKGIGFSRAGTLKAAVAEIVISSSAGMTPKELLSLLKIRAPNTLHNTLHGLVKSKHLRRHRLEGLRFYTNVDPEKAQKQIDTRQYRMQQKSSLSGPVGIETVIAILVEALKAGEAVASPSAISANLVAQGFLVSTEQINSIFAQYGILAGKKIMKRP